MNITHEDADALAERRERRWARELRSGSSDGWGLLSRNFDPLGDTEHRAGRAAYIKAVLASNQYVLTRS